MCILMIYGKLAGRRPIPAVELGMAEYAILLSEDYWCARLFPTKIAPVSDSIRCVRARRWCRKLPSDCWRLPSFGFRDESVAKSGHELKSQ